MGKLVSFFGIATLIAAAVHVCACENKVAAVDRPREQYDHMAPTEPSRLHVPVYVTREALADVVNAQLPAVLIDDDDFGGNGFELQVLRAGRTELAFRQNPTLPTEAPRLYYEVPLKIVLRKDALITKLRADGEITMKFSTVLGLKPTWEVTSRTELLGHRWTRRPQLGIGSLSIPIETLTNAVLDRVRREIARGIDQGIQDNVSLRPALEATLAGLATPQVLSADYGGYLRAEPVAIGVAPLREEAGGIGTTLQVDLRTSLTLSEPATARTPRLPPNTGVEGELDGFELSIQSLLGFKEMANILSKTLVDTTITASGRSATIKEVEVYGQGERLVVGVRLTGDYVGWAYLRARPVFDADSDRMELKDVDLALDTKNILYRTIGVLFRGRIVKALDQQIGDQVAAQLAAARTAIGEQLAGTEVISGVRVNGRADNVRISEALVTEDGLSAEIRFGGSLRVTLEKIPTE